MLVVDLAFLRRKGVISTFAWMLVDSSLAFGTIKMGKG